MAKVTITFDTADAEVDASWGTLLEVLNTRLPANRDLLVKEGLSAPIGTSLIYGILEVEVTQVDAIEAVRAKFARAEAHRAAGLAQWKDHRGTAAQREADKRSKQAIVALWKEGMALGIDLLEV